ncbi:adenosylcobinamide-GDP ribazoletransferase [Candidatus Nitrospira bockiana]
MVNSFLVAWHFLTGVPFTSTHHAPSPSEFARSMTWFPAVGLVLGSCLAVADLLLSGVFAPAVVNALLIVLLVLLTRGLHLDGLADMADGVAGGASRADRLAIMKDPRVGAIGASVLVLALGLRYAGLSALSGSERLPILICMPAVGRWSMVIAAFGMPYARAEGGLAQPFLHGLSVWQVMGSSVIVLGLLTWLFGPAGAVVSGVALVLVARALTSYTGRVLGGVTGDSLGATNEVVEIGFVIMVPVWSAVRHLNALT